jgi:tetratricopeptide (TPR) repeat protein
VAAVLDVAQREIRSGVEVGVKGPKRPTFGNNKERAEAVVAELNKNSPDAVRGAFKASMLVQAGKLDEAITEYRQHTKGKTLEAVLAREGLGIAIEMKAEQEKDAAARQKGLEEALAAFQAMQPDEKGPRYAYALYHQGRILALLGKNAEAKTQFEKAKELAGSTALASLIDERLAGLGA